MTHKSISFAKSALRLIGCLGVLLGGGVLWLGGWFASAELLGIIEELV